MKTVGFAKKLFALVIAACVLAGCNTVQGIGKDVKKAGEVVENAAKK
jgi:predicted small secreted protein